jgi:REP element-mobilizing transposase RayT
MKDYRHGAHTVFEIHLPLVWITKYRRPALTGDVALRVRLPYAFPLAALFRQLAQTLAAPPVLSSA